MDRINVAVKSGGDTLAASEVNAIVTAVNALIDWVNFFEESSQTTTDISYALINGLKSKYTWDGENDVEPNVSLWVGGKLLVAGKDYIIDYEDNDTIGTATMTFSGVGMYTGTKEATFAIEGKKYLLQYDTNGQGNAPQDVKVSVITRAELPTLTAEDYTFRGWWTQPVGGVSVQNGYILDGTTTIYAHWEQNTWTLTRNGMGVATTETISRVAELNSTNLTAPTFEGNYWFIGWFADSACTQLCDNLADKSLHGDTTIYAKFIDKDYEIILNDFSYLSLRKDEQDANTKLLYNKGAGWQQYDGSSQIDINGQTSIQAKVDYNNVPLGKHEVTSLPSIKATIDEKNETITFTNVAQGTSLQVTVDGVAASNPVTYTNLANGTVITADNGIDVATIEIEISNE